MQSLLFLKRLKTRPARATIATFVNDTVVINLS